VVWKDLCEVLSHPESITDALQRAHGGQWLPQELKVRQERTSTKAELPSSVSWSD
jgi:site-specific DNA recombinase